jgi:colicin import membrane protein
MGQASASAGFWLDDNRQADFSRWLWLAVAGSLVLHLAVLAIVAWTRLPQRVEKPLASIEISLATVLTPPVTAVNQQESQPKAAKPPRPAPPVKAADPPKSQPKAVEPPPPLPPVKAVDPPKSQPKVVEPPPPAPPVKAASVPAPSAPVKVPASDIMKRLELPPDAPKFGDFSPKERPARKQFTLPDVPVVSGTKEPVKEWSEVKPQPSLTEDLSKELEEELQNIRKVDLPKAAPPEPLPKPMPQVEAKATSGKAVDAALKISGMAPGSNAYLDIVRRQISKFWKAPPVDVTAQTYVVIVQFRLHRNGSVTRVEIEQSSGNEYYDLAGKRAVLSADPLPKFPPELAESYFDAHFSFTVGDSHG